VAAIERQPSSDQVFVAASGASGEEWRAPMRLAAEAAGGRRQPRVATGGPGEVYVAWADARAGVVDLYFNCSHDGGTTWLTRDVRLNTNVASGSRLGMPALACDDRGNVYAVWFDRREGFDAFYCNRSRDGGQTWLAADRRVTPLSLGRKSVPRLACDTYGNVYLAWIEERDGRQGVFANSSTDFGETWAFQDAMVSSGEAAWGAELCALDNGTVIVAWLEAVRNAGRIRVSRSIDRGLSWEAPRELPGGLDVMAVSAPRVRSGGLACAYVAWFEHTTMGSRLVLQSSVDGGSRYTAASMERSNNPGPLPLDPASREAPFSMAADNNGNAYFAWLEAEPGAWRVGFDRTVDYGRRWLQLQPTLDLEVPATLAVTGTSPVGALPLVAADDFGHVCIAWNSGDALRVAASPFYGDSGWRITEF
jgi:hypothetical protein